MPLVLKTVLALAAVLVAASCASSSRPQAVIYESQKGAVYLERFPDTHFKASHPFSLSQKLLARILSGVQIQDEKTTVQRLLASQSRIAYAFSDEEIAFLAPLLNDGLARATSEQQLTFRLVHGPQKLSLPEGGGAGVGSSNPYPITGVPETTAGTVFVHGQSLHLTLTQYRHRPERPDAINMPNRRFPDSTGLSEREIFFVPQAALRPETHKRTGLFGQPNTTTLVIDYQYMANLPDDQPLPTTAAIPPNPKGATAQESKQPPPISGEAASSQRATLPDKAGSGEELQSVKDLVIKKDMELEALKKELQALRRQLEEREPQSQNQMKRKSKPAPKPPEPSP